MRHSKRERASTSLELSTVEMENGLFPVECRWFLIPWMLGCGSVVDGGIVGTTTDD